MAENLPSFKETNCLKFIAKALKWFKPNYNLEMMLSKYYSTTPSQTDWLKTKIIKLISMEVD